MRAEGHMADENLVCFDPDPNQTDGDLDVVDFLGKSGYVTLISGRVSVFFKGDVGKLWCLGFEGTV